jgi:predicted DNA-binding transcriptional regulator YafY
VTHPTARVLALLEILQAGGTRTVAELARRLAVDERTVRRYVAHLIDLDIPVRSLRGRYGGYRLAPGYRLPPLMLTDDEAHAVLLGLLSFRRSETAAGPAVAAESAAAKLQRVLPVALADRLESLAATVAFTATPRSAATPEADVVLLLAQSARDRSPVAIGYVDRHGRRSDRTVHPYGVVAHAARWYVTGADSASGEVRLFRLDRITAPRVLAGSFDVPSGFDPAAQVLAALAEAPHRHEVAVLVEGMIDEVRPLLPPSVAIVEADADGRWCRVRIRAERLDWVPAVLAGTGRRFVVEHPEELRVLVRELGRRLLDAADPDQPKNASTA